MKTLIPALLSLSLLAGCGEDVVRCGHACPDAPINLPEGGEVRLEFVRRPFVATELRTYAWFASAQDPASRDFSRDPAEWRTFGSTLCANVSANQFIPQALPTSRTYTDVGEAVEFRNGANLAFSLPKVMNVQDEVSEVVHDIAYQTDVDPRAVMGDATYSVAAQGGQSYGTVYLPADYQVTFPDMEQQVNIPEGADFPFVWDSPQAVDEFMFSFVLFGDAIGPIVRCIGPNRGLLEVPASVIDSLPSSGVVQHGVFSHRVEAVEGRRVDKVGINCLESTYYKAPATP